MGVFLLHRQEWTLVLVVLLGLLYLRVGSAVKNARSRAKFEHDPIFKDAHQTELIKEWITKQYCKQDLEILCPKTFLIEANDSVTSSCLAAFTPPLQFVLDLDEGSTALQKNCSMANLISQTHWSNQATITDSNKDDTLVSFVAHALEQVRAKAIKHFRSTDGSIDEFEQSHLIGSVLASVVDLFSSPTRQGLRGGKGVNGGGKTLSTRATDFGLTGNIWTRSEVIQCLHDAVAWQTRLKRHGQTSIGAAARVSRQMPSFVFKFLTLVNEQILELETDMVLTSRIQKLYPVPQKEQLQTLSDSQNHSRQKHIPISQDHPRSDQCLWSHYEADSLISQDCISALETAPLRMRDLDWEGTFSFMMIHVFTWFSATYMIWMLSHLLAQNEAVANTNEFCSTQHGVDIDCHYTLSSNRGVIGISQKRQYAEQQIHTMQKVCLVYLIFSCLVGWVSSRSSETILFSDFLDGICMTLVGFVSLHHTCSLKLPQQSRNIPRDRDRHYKKLASLLDDEEDVA